MNLDYQLLGAGGFGCIIGWYVYYINRYRTGKVQLSDIVTVIGAIGGSAVTALFERGSELFGAYGIGLFIGFFGYFLLLAVWVARSPNFTADWFLDGRRKKPVDPWVIPDTWRPPNPAMAANPTDDPEDPTR